MKLIIFDLDQTLVDATAVHDKVTQKLFKEQFNVDARLMEIDFTGKDLRQNLSELASLKNITGDEYKEKSEYLLTRYDSIFQDTMPANAEETVLPGAKELLNELSMTENITALYTGDSRSVAKSILNATNLGKYFKFHLYGTEVETRADMVSLAIEKAKKITGQNFKNEEIVIIGDSVRDIECGKIFNALTIAVATGFHSINQLYNAKPNFLFTSLKDYQKVLKILTEKD